MIIRLRDKLLGRHCHTRVFIGVDQDHLQLSGNLVMEIGEWQLFGAALLMGAAKSNGRLTVELPDSDAMSKSIQDYQKEKV